MLSLRDDDVSTPNNKEGNNEPNGVVPPRAATANAQNKNLSTANKKVSAANNTEGNNDSDVVVVVRNATANASNNSSMLPQWMFGSNAPNNRSVLPQWMFDYFLWHKEQLAQLNPENWMTKRFLIPRCLMMDKPCGGTSDRLHSLPFMIKLAHKTKRILFYKWTRPCNLEEFLRPAVPQGGNGGINWTLPDWLHDRLDYNSRRGTNLLREGDVGDIYFVKSNARVVTFILQAKDYGRRWYEKTLGTNESTWNQVYSELWHRTFLPSPAVEDRIETVYRSLSLNRHDYVAIQVRSHYRFSGGPNNVDILKKALNCSSHLPTSDAPSSQIYVAADDLAATKHALEYGRGHQRADVVAQSASDILNNNNTPPNPLHLDFNQSTQPSDYYDTFIDLYLLANARCVAYGQGGFGKWTRLINRHGCSIYFYDRDLKCTWNEAMKLVPQGAS